MSNLVGVEPVQPDPAPHADYPKWIVPHASHIDASGRALAFKEFHKGRDGVVKVLVTSRNDEEIALEPKSGSETEFTPRPEWLNDVKDIVHVPDGDSETVQTAIGPNFEKMAADIFNSDEPKEHKDG